MCPLVRDALRRHWSVGLLLGHWSVGLLLGGILLYLQLTGPYGDRLARCNIHLVCVLLRLCLPVCLLLLLLLLPLRPSPSICCCGSATTFCSRMLVSERVID